VIADPVIRDLPVCKVAVRDRPTDTAHASDGHEVAPALFKTAVRFAERLVQAAARQLLRLICHVVDVVEDRILALVLFALAQLGEPFRPKCVSSVASDITVRPCTLISSAYA
jgi:hypothetical protein